MKDIFKTIGKSLLIVFALTIVNCLLLVGSFCIPTGKMRQHVAESYPLIEAEHPYMQWDQGYTSSMLDGWAEYTLYGMAINEDSEGNAFEKAMFMRFIDTNGMDRDKSVELYARYPDEYFEQSSYPRYWNGSVMIIKLLFLFFTIPDIRMINMFLHLGLLILVIIKMVKKGLDKYIIPFLVTILFINPITMIYSVKFSTEYIPMLLGILILLGWGDRIGKIKGGYELFFALMGSIVSFFCFLSFPGITLGVPLVLLIWLNNEKNVTKTVISSSCFWAGAYGFTWLLKWVICSLFTSYNLIEDAINQMIYYEGPGRSGATVMERLIHNLWAYKTTAFMLLFAIAIAIVVISVLAAKKNVSVKEPATKLWDVLFGYFLVMCIPFAIIIGLGNGYAYNHYFMAHRQFAITVLGSLCILRYLAAKVISFKK